MIHAPNAPEVLGKLGFKHQPGQGYKPELDPYQRYTGEGLGFEAIHAAMTAEGFWRTRGPEKMYGGHVALCFARCVGPYHDESVCFESRDDGATFTVATHYAGRVDVS